MAPSRRPRAWPRSPSRRWCCSSSARGPTGGPRRGWWGSCDGPRGWRRLEGVPPRRRPAEHAGGHGPARVGRGPAPSPVGAARRVALAARRDRTRARGPQRRRQVDAAPARLRARPRLARQRPDPSARRLRAQPRRDVRPRPHRARERVHRTARGWAGARGGAASRRRGARLRRARGVRRRTRPHLQRRHAAAARVQLGGRHGPRPADPGRGPGGRRPRLPATLRGAHRRAARGRHEPAARLALAGGDRHHVRARGVVAPRRAACGGRHRRGTRGLPRRDDRAYPRADAGRRGARWRPARRRRRDGARRPPDRDAAPLGGPARPGPDRRRHAAPARRRVARVRPVHARRRRRARSRGPGRHGRAGGRRTGRGRRRVPARRRRVRGRVGVRLRLPRAPPPAAGGRAGRRLRCAAAAPPLAGGPLMPGTGVAHVELTAAAEPLALGAVPLCRVLVTHRGVPVAYEELANPGDGIDDAALLALLLGDLPDAVARAAATEADLAARMRVPDRAAPPLSVSVVVCTRRRPDTLADLLQALTGLRSPPAEVLVVDNDPGAKPCEGAVRAHGFRYLRGDRTGLNRARAAGLAAARGDVVAFVDDDCVPPATWLERLPELFADPSVGAVTGPAFAWTLATPAQARFEREDGFRRGLDSRRHDWSLLPPVRAAVAGAGANMAFRRTALDAMDEAFPGELDAGTPTQSGGDMWALAGALGAGWRGGHNPPAGGWGPP